jgi:hypothetical protein
MVVSIFGIQKNHLPIQKMETTISQKACDQLAVKIGQNMSTVN